MTQNGHVNKPLSDKVILVVDDIPLDRELAASILRKKTGAKIIHAENGAEALESVEREKPDLVLTDMQMPEMDGLELVETIRATYPFIPSVLITAHGSEDIAVRALQRGAASYVRKPDMARRLVDTITDVLALTHGYRQQERLRKCWDQTEFRFCIDNDDSVIPVLVVHLQQYASSINYVDETESFRVGVALHEALRNAIEHGNLEMNSELRHSHEGDARYYQLAEERRAKPPFCHRRVHFTVRERESDATYVIRDEGPGFDKARMNYDPTSPENINKPSGRGLMLIHSFMDEVHLNDQGNEITMIYRRNGQQSIAV